MNGAVFELGLIVVLILLNGVFSATEIALVTIRRSRIQQLIDEGNRAAERVQRLKSNPGRFLAVIQVGINFLGFLASAFAAVSLVDGMANWLAQFGPLQDVAEAVLWTCTLPPFNNWLAVPIRAGEKKYPNKESEFPD